MSELFLKIVNMSIAASWLILAVLILRLVLRKAPKWVHVLLWGLVAVRLVCPFSIESALSLIPSAETVPPTILMDPTPSVQTGISALDRAVDPIIGGSLSPAPGASANPLQIWVPILSAVWAVGMGALFLYAAVSYLRLRRRVSQAVLLRDDLYQSEAVGSPFVLGIIKPRIYLPFNMSDRDLEHVVAHERAHIRRKDHWWKPLGFLLLTVHWFNPLVWLAYVLLCRDIEFACDEKVIRELGHEQRADYTQALVSCGVDRRGVAACPLAFGEVGVKRRVKSILHYKKPTVWIVAVAVVLCGAAAVCLLTDPVSRQTAFIPSRPSPAGMTYTYEGEGFGGAFEIAVKEDGTFTYYEGLLSSYIGYGTWSVSDDVLTLTDDTGVERVNHFKMDGERLLFVEKDSSNFIYVKVEDGAVFHGVATTARPKDGSGAILDYLGATEETAALVEDALETPNASLRLDDTEITVTQILRDDRFAYLAYEIELPENFPEDGQPPWSATDFYLVAGNGEKIPSLNFHSVFSERSGHVARVVAEACLGGAAGDACDAVLVLTRPEDAAGGDLRELRWSLAPSPLARTLEPNVQVREDGTVLTRLTVSPLSVYATLEGSGSIVGLTVNVFFRDGTMFDATRASVSSHNDLDFSEPGAPVVRGGEVGYPFGRIVDVGAIERVVVGSGEVLVG